MKKQHPISNRPVPSLLPQEVKHNPDLSPVVQPGIINNRQGVVFD